jgi:hypothetical protein
LKKEGWPEFPYFWIEKPNMSSLRDLASHLKEKSEALRMSSGFRGETSPMEKQIIESLSVLQQQVREVTDVVLASLQIIDDQRPSQRVKRVVGWIREKVKKYWRKMEESTPYKILAAVGALATLWLIYKILICLFHHFRK